MHAETQPRSGLLRFLDSFMQEHNIKWVLAVGTAILVASSLMLIGPHWEHVTPLWKYVTALGYYGALIAIGQWVFHRLVLRRTGTALQALALVSGPVLFHVLRWVPGTLTVSLLFTATLALTALAAWRIFGWFLRGPQPTFVASYLLLSAAGTFAVGPALAPWAALAAWAVFSAGAVKVSRHAFWLVETHHRPRLFGFVPVLLLGAQFLMLVTTWLPHLSLPWLGLGCALVAVPLLGTTDALARVFISRTGDLVRPLPAAIIAPLAAAVVLCVAAVSLAAAGLALDPRAMVPTALLAALLLAAVARRLRSEAFVWAALVAFTLAYNFSPAFFLDLARAVVARAARGVAEESLPYAFYGFTYLPLIAVTTWLAVRARAVAWLERPTRLFAVGLTHLLVAASLTHPKAALPVGLALAVVLAAQTVALRRRPLALSTLAALAIAALGIDPIVYLATGVALAPAHLWCVGFALAAALALAAPRLDAFLLALDPAPRWPERLGALAADAATLVLAASWVVVLGELWLGVATAVGLFVLLVHRSLAGERRWLAGVTVAFAYLALGVLVARVADAEAVLGVLTSALLAHWGAAHALARRTDLRLVRVFGRVSLIACTIALSAVLVLVHLPVACLDVLGASRLHGPDVSWLLRALGVLWAFEASRSARHVLLGGLGVAALFALVAAALVRGGAEPAWIVPAWSALALVSAWPIRALEARPELRTPLLVTARVVLLGAAVVTLPFATLPLRLGGLLALAGLFALARRAGWRPGLAGLEVLVPWQLIAIGGTLLTESGDVWLRPSVFVEHGLALAVLATLAVVIRRGSSTAVLWNRFALFAFSLFMVLGSLALPQLHLEQVIAALLVFGLLCADRIAAALRTGHGAHVWLAQIVAAAAVSYLAAFHVVHFGRGISMFAVSVLGIALYAAARSFERREATRVLAGPFGLSGAFLPFVTVLLALYRAVAHPGAAWVGVASLALLLPAAFYFWLALDERSPSLHVLAAGIVNLALGLLWRELGVSDPQLYMVPAGISIIALTQVLSREIPAAAHTPLRYAGALVILVSPTFDILGGSWLHLFSLMVLSSALVLVAIGLRARPLAYTGAAFLAADLVAVVVRGSLDHPSVLWLAGLGLGASVLALGAVAERNRERLVGRVRALACELEEWS
jgi:hypothetical protein